MMPFSSLTTFEKSESRTRCAYLYVVALAFMTFAFSPQLSAETGAENQVISGKFELTNHLGDPVNEQTYKGMYRLVFFGFIQCPDICPTTMVQLAAVMDNLGENQDLVKPIFISVDHENDSVEKLAQYVGYFHSSFDGLTGTPEQIRRAADQFNTTYGHNKDTFSNTETGYYHSSYVYLLGMDGELIDLFSHSTSAEIIAERVSSLL